MPHGILNTMLILLLGVALTYGQCVPNDELAPVIRNKVNVLSPNHPFYIGFDLFSSVDPLWDDSLGPLQLVESELQNITMTGTGGCKFVDELNGDGIYWTHWLPWPNTALTPANFGVVFSTDIECRISFSNPISVVQARVNRGATNEGYMSIHGVDDSEISCAIISQNETTNGFTDLGFNSTVPIASIRWRGGVIVFDMITWLCPQGLIPSDSTCIDQDECAGDPCDENAACDNTIGSFTCTCNEGYTGTGIGAGGCRLIDCSDAPCDPDATCTDGATFTCACNEGYTGDGFTCEPVPAPLASPSTTPSSNAPGTNGPATSAPVTAPSGAATSSAAHMSAAYMVGVLSVLLGCA